MSLELTKCGNCKFKYYAKNTGTYCLTCQKQIKKELREIASKNKHASNKGIHLFKEHKKGLSKIDVLQLKKVIP